MDSHRGCSPEEAKASPFAIAGRPAPTGEGKPNDGPRKRVRRSSQKVRDYCLPSPKRTRIKIKTGGRAMNHPNDGSDPQSLGQNPIKRRRLNEGIAPAERPWSSTLRHAILSPEVPGKTMENADTSELLYSTALEETRTSAQTAGTPVTTHNTTHDTTRHTTRHDTRHDTTHDTTRHDTRHMRSDCSTHRVARMFDNRLEHRTVDLRHVLRNSMVVGKAATYLSRTGSVKQFRLVRASHDGEILHLVLLEQVAGEFVLEITPTVSLPP